MMKKASVFAVEESCGRQQMLDKVFRKALSVSVNSISDTDLNECFGELRTPFGSAFGKVFINMMGRGEASMDAAYTDLCIRHDMDDKLRALESAPPAPRLDLTSPDPLAATLLELKRLEADELRAANKHMEAEIKKLSDAAMRVQAHLAAELSSCREESGKLQDGVNHCTS